MKDDVKKTIDGMGYESMLSLWRFAEVGHPFFQEDTGTYFTKVMQEKEKLLAPGEKSKISKSLGWKL